MERRIEPLRPRSVQTESVPVGDASEGGEQRSIEGLKPRSVQAERAGIDATLVIEDEKDEAREQSASELLGEVQSLRSRNALLRAERTSIAGRKYALEVTLESLKERLGQLAELCEALDAPGELGEALRRLREMVGDARAVAEGKELIDEATLESERAERLRAQQALETKVSELSEQSIGYKAERDTLRERAGRLERERLELLERLAELEQARTDARSSLEAASAQESSAAERVKELEQAVVDAAETAQTLLRRAELAEQDVEKLGPRVSELEQQLEALREEGEVHRMNMSELERRLEEATALADEASRGKEAAETRATAAEEEIAALKQSGGKDAEKKDSLIAELRGALTEIKPVFDELDKENRRLSRLLGEARERGRVNVEELIAREQLLRKLDRLTRLP